MLYEDKRVNSPRIFNNYKYKIPNIRVPKYEAKFDKIKEKNIQQYNEWESSKLHFK